MAMAHHYAESSLFIFNLQANEDAAMISFDKVYFEYYFSILEGVPLIPCTDTGSSTIAHERAQR